MVTTNRVPSMGVSSSQTSVRALGDVLPYWPGQTVVSRNRVDSWSRWLVTLDSMSRAATRCTTRASRKCTNSGTGRNSALSDALINEVKVEGVLV